MANFRLVDRDTSYLLPPSVDEWLPEGHLARFVVEITDQLDISAIERQYTGSGSDAYHPRMLLALLFYSYATGTFFSRKIETASFESVPTRYVAGNQHPDHDTICTFRRRFLGPIGELFTQILLVAAEMDMVELGDISIAGTKVNANASKHKAMSWDRMLQLEDQLSEEVPELLERAEQLDAEQAETESLPEELERRTERLAQIQEAKARIEERAQKRYEQEKDEHKEKMAVRDAREHHRRQGLLSGGQCNRGDQSGAYGLPGPGAPQTQPALGRAPGGEWNLVQCAYNLKRMHALAG
jgi:transposase